MINDIYDCQPSALNIDTLMDYRCNKLQEWHSRRFKLKYREIYPEKLISLKKQIVNLIINYLSDQSLQNKMNLSHRRIKSYALDWLEGKPIEDFLNYVIEYQDEIGLELAE